MRLNGPRAQQTTDQHLIQNVTEGVTMTRDNAQTFATDGRLYAFTTLRPPPPPDGALRIVAWDVRMLNLMLFGGLALVGLVGVRQPTNTKLIAVTVLLIALVLAGVFAPTFAMQIMDINLLIALVVLLFVWLVAAVISYQRTLAATAVPAPPVVADGGAATVTDAESSADASPFAGETSEDESDADDEGEADEEGESDKEGGPSDA